MANQTETLTQAVGYRWLAQFFLHRPSLSDLEQYRGEDGRQFLAACKAVPALSTLAALIETATATDECLAQLQAGLARAVSQAFDMAGNGGACLFSVLDAGHEAQHSMVNAGDGAALLSRLQLEGARSDADIVLGLDTNITARAKATGLFAKLSPAPTGLDVPVDWSDDTFASMSCRYP